MRAEESKSREIFEKKKQEVLSKGKPFKGEFGGLKLGQGLNQLNEYLKAVNFEDVDFDELIKNAEEASVSQNQERRRP